MNQQVKEKWLAALRSGEYKQGKKMLRTADDKFCCLGVLCDLYAKEVGEEWGDTNDVNYPYDFFEISTILPTEVQEWAGITHSDPEVGQTTLAQANDGGESFKKIADLIERYL